MTVPRLAVARSGYGGRGYKNPFDGTLVPSVTTVLRMAASPAITQWAVDQTAAYAVANIDELLKRTEEQGWGFLRWYHKRELKKIEEGFDVRNYHLGVLNEAADLGTSFHEWVEADLVGYDYPDTTLESDRFWQMVEVWDRFKSEHTIEPVLMETTVWHALKGYAGTFDILAYIDGVLTLLDIKTARGIWPDHFMQLGALKNATTYMSEGFDGWQENDWTEIIGTVEQYGFLHVRPDDFDNKGSLVPAYCSLDLVDSGLLDVYTRQFEGLLLAKQAELDVKQYEKEVLKSEPLSNEVEKPSFT